MRKFIACMAPLNARHFTRDGEFQSAPDAEEIPRVEVCNIVPTSPHFHSTPYVYQRGVVQCTRYRVAKRDAEARQRKSQRDTLL